MAAARVVIPGEAAGNSPIKSSRNLAAFNFMARASSVSPSFS